MFEEELTYIKDERMQKAAKILLDNLPEYFYHISASSTGKYHPPYAEGEGGLVRHTKAAVRIAKELMEITPYDKIFACHEKDAIIITLLIHDGLKKGKVEEQYTRFDHPILAAEYVEEMQKKAGLTKKEATFIAHSVKTHMGKWTTDYFGNEVLECPHDKYQYFVHLCDYLASRKFLDVHFDEKGKIIG